MKLFKNSKVKWWEWPSLLVLSQQRIVWEEGVLCNSGELGLKHLIHNLSFPTYCTEGSTLSWFLSVFLSTFVSMHHSHNLPWGACSYHLSRHSVWWNILGLNRFTAPLLPHVWHSAAVNMLIVCKPGYMCSVGTYTVLSTCDLHADNLSSACYALCDPGFGNNRSRWDNMF